MFHELDLRDDLMNHSLYYLGSGAYRDAFCINKQQPQQLRILDEDIVLKIGVRERNYE